jgi:hypothetical protein
MEGICERGEDGFHLHRSNLIYGAPQLYQMTFSSVECSGGSSSLSVVAGVEDGGSSSLLSLERVKEDNDIRTWKCLVEFIGFDPIGGVLHDLNTLSAETTCDAYWAKWVVEWKQGAALAMCMCSHPKLGKCSVANSLLPDILKLIFDLMQSTDSKLIFDLMQSTDCMRARFELEMDRLRDEFGDGI